MFFGSEVTEHQKRPRLAYDSKTYGRHDVKTNKVGFLYSILQQYSIFWRIQQICMNLEVAMMIEYDYIL